MKRLLLPLFFIFSLFIANGQQTVSIGTDKVNQNAVLWLNSAGKNQALILPIASIRTVINSPEKGMIVFDESENKIYYHNGGTWLEVGGGGTGGGTTTYSLSLNGNSIQLLENGLTPVSTISISSKTNGPSANEFLMYDGGKWTSVSLGQDITSTDGTVTVNGLKGKTIPALPSTTQALVYNGTNWVFQAIGGSGTVTNIATGNGLTGGPITTTGTISVNVGTGSNQIPQLDATGKLLPAVLPTAIDANAADDITTATTAGGDLTGTYPNPTVNRIQGRAVSATAPTDQQVLKWNQTNTRWEPSADATGAALVPGNLTTTTTGLSITGGTGAVIGTGTTVNIQNATTSQPGLLTSADWNTFNTKVGLASNPAAGDITGSYTAGFQLGANAVSGTEIANGTVTVAKLVTAGAGDANKVFSTNGSGTPQLETKASFLSGTLTTGTTAGGDLTGTYPNPTIATSSGNNIVNAINDAATTGFVNTAKLSTSVVLDSESPAGGDINGSYSGGFQLGPNVIMDADISSSAAITGTKINPNFGSQNVTTSGTVDTKTFRLTGELILDDGTPDTGTAGQFLTSAGPGVVPTWTTTAASFLTLNAIPRGDGSGLVASSFYDDGSSFTGLGTNTGLTTFSRFEIETSEGAGAYGGMYVKTSEADGRPFYGYGNGGLVRAYSYVDGLDSHKWKLFNGTADHITVDVNGNTGIGTTIANNRLDVEGGAVIGATYSGTNTAPTNGALIQGSVGIGLTSLTSGAKLEISGGDFRMTDTFPFAIFNASTSAGNAGIKFEGSGTGRGWIYYRASSNEIFFSNTTSGTTDHMTISTAGRVGMSRSATTNTLEVEGNASKTASGSWLANSDRRIKTEILDIDNSIETIKKLRPVKFRYTDYWKKKHPSIKDEFYYNFIAQEYQQVFPESVQGSGEFIDGDSREILQIDTYNAQIVTIKAVQELIKKVEALEKENAQLKAEKGSLEKDLKAEIAEIKKALSIEAKANPSTSQNK